MLRQIEAIYEGGLLRPLEPVELPESEQGTRTISISARGGSKRDWAVVEMARTETARLARIPIIEEVRAALSVIPGSFPDDVIADRGDY